MITIDGKKYKVTENMGFNHSIGKYCKMVDDNGKERMSVKSGKKWRFWTAEDRLGRKRKTILNFMREKYELT